MLPTAYLEATALDQLGIVVIGKGCGFACIGDGSGEECVVVAVGDALIECTAVPILYQQCAVITVVDALGAAGDALRVARAGVGIVGRIEANRRVRRT